ncbi:hypothetical protein DSM112329_03730 [Paraconexibacter sp. AEG42_29]|uniref:LysE family translocator n=1 Tax=Paraconexibacter sp. AEG42_29 TaxID=2997339 RepID=A0AAU7AYR0_9ACTN
MALTSTDLAELLGTALAVLAVPGPSVLFVVARGVAGGRPAALLAVVAVGLGLLVQVIAVAVGLGSLLTRSDLALTLVRAGGAVALIVLGIRAYRGRHDLAAEAAASAPGTRPARVLRDGVTVGVLNPKRLLLLVALLPQFVTTGGPPAPVQLLLLGGLVVGAGLVCDTVWGLAAGTARGWLKGRRAVLERFGAVAAAVMVALGLRLALTL